MCMCVQLKRATCFLRVAQHQLWRQKEIFFLNPDSSALRTFWCCCIKSALRSDLLAVSVELSGPQHFVWTSFERKNPASTMVRARVLIHVISVIFAYAIYWAKYPSIYKKKKKNCPSPGLLTLHESSSNFLGPYTLVQCRLIFFLFDIQSMARRSGTSFY